MRYQVETLKTGVCRSSSQYRQNGDWTSGQIFILLEKHYN